MSKSVSVDDRTRKLLLAIIMKYRKELTESIRTRTGVEAGSITSADILEVTKFSGAGGKTFIINSSIQTVAAGQIDGGIVLKYAKDLDSEVENANYLNRLLEKRQKEFEEANFDLPESMNWFPRQVFAPKVLGVYPEAGCLVLEFLGNVVPLEKSKLRKFEDRFRLLGYGLGRFHGLRQVKVRKELYLPLFRALEGIISADSLETWRSEIGNSPGGAEYIHGDSHFQNIMFGPGRLAFIDAILVPGLDRMDDLGYAISHYVQETLALAETPLQLKTAAKSLMNRLVTKVVPKALATYSAAISNIKIYDNLPFDFFLGAHLIVRSQLYDGFLAEGLKSMGIYFAEERPFCELITR
ncbi:MAG: hypothetical protein ACE5OZ_05100 [Candidatus Heimdallarchaeota archaeon]